MATALESLKRLKFESGLTLLVDGFQFQRSDIHHYVLSHFHSDHTIGLQKGFSAGKIYCTQTTGILVREHIGVAEEFIYTLPLLDTLDLDCGTRMTFLDAGHCPGSAIIVFEECATGRIVVHTGDLRASDDIRKGLMRWLDGKLVNELYLDTTYCSTRWDFPDQAISCQWMQEIVRRELDREPNTLFLVGSYQIGKEKAARAVAEAARSTVFVDHRRWTSIKATHWASESLASGVPLWSIDKADCNVWMLPLGGLNHEVLLHHLESCKGCYKSVVAFRPTGWSFTGGQRLRGLEAIKPWIENDGTTRLYGVPYSEHSSFTELKALVQDIKPKHVVPTVNVETRASKERVMAPLLGLLDLKEDRERMDYYLFSGACRQDQKDDIDGLVDVLALSGQGAVCNFNGLQSKIGCSCEYFIASSKTSSSSSSSSLPSTQALRGSDPASSVPCFGTLASRCENYIDLDADSEEDEVTVLDASNVSQSHAQTKTAEIPHRTCENKEAKDELSVLRQVDTAQQRRLLKYFETLKMQADAKLHPQRLKPKIAKGSAKSKGKGKGKRAPAPSQSALAAQLGVKVEKEDKKKSKDVKRKPKGVLTSRRQQPRKRKSVDGEAADAEKNKERRLTRFVPKPSARIRERMDRAYVHRLYLLAHQDVEPASSSASSSVSEQKESDRGVWLDVLGSTGNVYRVTLSFAGSQCQCPDFAKGGGVCKHLLFVMLRVLKLSREDHRVWQTSLTMTELQPLLAHLRDRHGQLGELAADASVLRGYREAKDGEAAAPKQPLPAECPICFEEISETNTMCTCRACGHHLHADCQHRWAASSSKGDTCPLCRSPWKSPASSDGDKTGLNLSAYAAEPTPSLQDLYPETHQWMSRNAQAHCA